MSGESLRSEILQALAKERRTYLRSWLFTGISLIAGGLWIFYSYQQVARLNNERIELEHTIARLTNDIEEQNSEKMRIENLIRQRKVSLGSLEALVSLTGKRKLAINLAYDLQSRGYPFVMGGRKPEDGGFDLSGFIDYVLSRPEIGIIRQSDVPNCNIDCLRRYPGITEVSTLAQLQPGDLIFYPKWNQTMLYLGGTNCIGMMYMGTIEIRDVNFGPDPIYSKVTYKG